MIVETEVTTWLSLRLFRSMHKYDLVKYNKTDVNSNLIRIEFLRTNYYKKFKYRNDMYEDIVVTKKSNLEEGECFVYVDKLVPNDRLKRLTKTLKDRYAK